MQVFRNEKNLWVCMHPEKKIFIEWEDRKFNETQKCVYKDANLSPLVVARIMREIGDYLAQHHREKIEKIPAYEYEIENNKILRLRNPKLSIDIPEEYNINNPQHRKQVANALKKCGEWLNKEY